MEFHSGFADAYKAGTAIIQINLQHFILLVGVNADPLINWNRQSHKPVLSARFPMTEIRFAGHRVKGENTHAPDQGLNGGYFFAFIIFYNAFKNFCCFKGNIIISAIYKVPSLRKKRGG